MIFDNDIKKYKFDFELSDAEINKIYDIYINSKINNCDKKYIYFIISFIRGNSYYKDKYQSNIILFLDFCLNEKVYLDNNFSLILNKIYNEINIINNKTNTFKEKEILKRKILLFILTRNNNINKYVFKDFNQILKCDLNNINDNYIIDLFFNDKLSLNKEKRNIIIKEIINERVNADFFNKKLYYSFLELLTNDYILTLDNLEYKEIVQFALKNINAYILNEVINIFDNDKEKIKIVINYIYNVLETYPYTPKMIDNQALESSLKLEIFSIINILKDNDITELKNKLNIIENSKRPISTSNILSCLTIKDKKLEFAMDLVNNSIIVEEELNPNIYNDYYKYVLSLASISPVLNNMPLDYYKKILLIINEFINEGIKNPSNMKLFNTSLKGIINILNNPNFINIDYFRLRYIIYTIISAPTKETSKEISNFLNNEILNYYSIGEYIRALNILKDNLEAPNFNAIKNLLTNKNLPYMTEEEKNRMFVICQSNNIDSIFKLTKDLTSIGYINRNNERLIKILTKK